MLQILFTADDLASTRFLPEPAPLLELKFAAIGLRRGIRAVWGEQWHCSALAAIPMSARPTVRQLGGQGRTDGTDPAWGAADDRSEIRPIALARAHLVPSD
jgi:hypothetical protein